jgi:hypothetical protein
MMSQNASGLELNLTGRPVSDLFAEAFADDGPMPFSSAGGKRWPKTAGLGVQRRAAVGYGFQAQGSNSSIRWMGCSAMRLRTSVR